MPPVFSSINGQKRSRLPAVIGAVIFMLILSLGLSRPGFIQAQAEKAPPDEQKVVEWLVELKADTEGEDRGKRDLWHRKYALGLSDTSDPLMALYEKGNPLAGVFFELSAKKGESPYNAPGEAEKWAKINRANNIINLLEPLSATNTTAMKLMAIITANGLAGCSENSDDIIKWMRKAAEAGDVEAQKFLLGRAVHSHDVEERTAEKHKEVEYWVNKLNISAGADDCKGLADVFFIAHLMKEVKKLRPDQRAESKIIETDADLIEAVRWYKKGAELGDAACQAALAGVYESGGSVPVDYAEAKHWYEKAAENGNDAARLLLILYYTYGEPGPKADHSQTFNRYRQLADSGAAMRGLGSFLDQCIPAIMKGIRKILTKRKSG